MKTTLWKQRQKEREEQAQRIAQFAKETKYKQIEQRIREVMPTKPLKIGSVIITENENA